ncbi:MAG: orotate phosphoribosyltransferase [Chloroflexota bacterium]
MEDLRQALLDLIIANAIHFGSFTLSSGLVSHFYIDCRKVTLSARGASLTGTTMLDLLRDVDIQAVGGMTVAADPVATAIAVESWHRQRPLNAFIVRKEAKGHGLHRQVEGPLKPGDRVAVVDDTLTTGGSIFQAIEAVEAAGATVAAVAVILDRLQGGADRIRERGYPVSSVLTYDDIRDFVEARQPPT